MKLVAKKYIDNFPYNYSNMEVNKTNFNNLQNRQVVNMKIQTNKLNIIILGKPVSKF